MPTICRFPKYRCGYCRGSLSVSAVVALLVLTAGCSERRDISRVAPFSEMIGHSYRIVGDVDGQGVKPLLADVPPDYVLLEPRFPGYTGPEIAFTRPVPRGQVFRIAGAWMFDTLIDDTRYYVVEFEQQDALGPRVPVHLPLRGGNESANGELNPQYYQRVR
jgi:hypothetical protein